MLLKRAGQSFGRHNDATWRRVPSRDERVPGGLEAVADRNTSRTDMGVVDALATIGVVTIHDAQHRVGLMAIRLRSIYRSAHFAVNAATREVRPGNN